MRTTLFISFILTFLNGYSQDTLKIKQIDALVSNINSSSLPVQRDTLRQDRPEMGLKMTTYLTMIVNGNELIKYVNNVNTSMIANRTIKQMNASNTFYYDHNKLIKVEEYIIEGDKRGEANWYYADDKPLYYTLKSGKAEDRANFLLTQSKTILKQVIK